MNKLTTYTCLRCGYGGGEKKWVPRVPRPKHCPRCGSRRWDTPRTGNPPGPKPKRFFEEAAEQHLRRCNAELDTTPDQK